MDRNKISKGLELLLIPLFALMSTSCTKTTKSDLITIDNNKYFVTVNTATKMTVATKDQYSEGITYFYQLIDSTGDGNADTKRGGAVYDKYNFPTIIIEKADSSDQAEYRKIYSKPEVKALLK